MKHLYLFLLLILLTFTEWAHAQTPQSINYQAVARDGETGGELISQPVDVIFKILDDGFNGTIVFQESHETETNAFGLVNLQIGNGDPIAGTMEDIDWSTGEKWLVVEMDLGEGFEEVSSSRFISVPYALHAEVAGTAVDIDDADADPTNELIDTLLIVNNVLQSYEGGFPDGNMKSVDLTELVDDADADPTNELIDPDNIELIDTLLYITEGGITHEINLAGLANYGPWQVGPGTVFNTEAYIGVGTEDPVHKLHVNNQSDEVTDSVAVYGHGQHPGTVNYGVVGRAEGGTENRAVYGDAPGNNENRWAGYFDRGNVHVANRLAVGELNPHSTVHSNGSVAGSVRYEEATIGDISLLENDYMLIVDVSDGQGLVILPPASTCEGRIYFIKRTYSSPTNNTLQIAPSPGENIDGTAFPILLSSASARESRMLVSAGANGWFVLSE